MRWSPWWTASLANPIGRARRTLTPAKTIIDETGFKNADLMLLDGQILANIHLSTPPKPPPSDKLVTGSGVQVNLDVEMETGTGKTYCYYIKTIFELNKRLAGTNSLSWFPASLSGRAL